jgi:acyl carrier protein
MLQDRAQIDSFIEKFERLLDVPPAAPLTSETFFRELPGWTSLQALVTIIGFDEDYGVTINSHELLKAKTLGDLCSLIRQKLEV